MYTIFYSLYHGTGIDDRPYWINLSAGPFVGRAGAEQTLASLASNPNFRGGRIGEVTESSVG